MMSARSRVRMASSRLFEAGCVLLASIALGCGASTSSAPPSLLLPPDLPGTYTGQLSISAGEPMDHCVTRALRLGSPIPVELLMEADGFLLQGTLRFLPSGAERLHGGFYLAPEASLRLVSRACDRAITCADGRRFTGCAAEASLVGPLTRSGAATRYAGRYTETLELSDAESGAAAGRIELEGTFELSR